MATTNSGLPVSEGSLSAKPFPPPGIARGLAPYITPTEAGTLPFYFRVPGNANAIVPNGGGAEGDVAFWWKTGSGSLENVVYAGLRRRLNPGEPSDNDHDDMIVRITALPIPEPGTGALLLLGLAGSGAAARRRSSARVQRSARRHQG